MGEEISQIHRILRGWDEGTHKYVFSAVNELVQTGGSLGDQEKETRVRTGRTVEAS